MLIGQGFDVHRFAPNRKLRLGGIEVEHRLGLEGHSDADVLLHAITDALLGAMALGDIGSHFPDTDSIYLNIDSAVLLHKVWQMVIDRGLTLVNLDTTVIAQQPKLSGYIPDIRENIATLLGVDLAQVSVKATTTERLGFTGREEGIAAMAILLLRRV